MKSKKAFCVVITAILVMNITVCSKSRGKPNDATDSSGSNGISNIIRDMIERGDINYIGGRERKNDTNSEEGLEITVTDIPYDDGYSLYFGIYDTENYGKEVYPLADAHGEIKNGCANLEPHAFVLSKIPWTMPGEYYIRFGLSFDNVFHFYTNGHTLTELGINGFPETDDDYRKLPTCILGPGENFINFSQQVLRIERGK